MKELGKLVVESLSVTYPNGKQAVNKVNLSISNGIFGLLGPNGAGKSTLMSAIVGVVPEYEGCINFLGSCISKQRHKIGFLPQDIGFYPELTIQEVIQYCAALKNIPFDQQCKDQIAYLLDKTNLLKIKSQKVRSLSGGMVQRLGLVQALLGEPQLLVIDEPTVGLDPKERFIILEYLHELAKHKVVILSSHEVQDIADVSSNIGILSNGELLFTGYPKEAIESVKDKIWLMPAQKQIPSNVKYKHLTNKLFEGKLYTLVYAIDRPDGAVLAAPSLEAYYLTSVLNRYAV